MNDPSPLSELEKCFQDFNASLTDIEKAYGRISRQIDEYRSHEIVPRNYLEELAGNLAHEIRNPLAGIAMLVELLSKESSKTQMENIQGILEGVQRIDTIVENLIVFSQPVRFQTVRCNLSDLLKRAAETARAWLGERNRDYPFVLPLPLEQVYVEVDPVLMLQAIQNLLRNAVEVMPDGGQTTIKVTLNQPKNKVKVSIEDEGPGLPNRDFEKPFYPFHTTKTYGMGLGLPTSRLIVEKHGGKISLKNRDQKGLQVTLTLPIT
ncbi:MAG: nitrogen regulation protein NR(II) [bacterium]